MASPNQPATLPASALPQGVKVTGVVNEAFAEILTHDALLFVADLARRFTTKRDKLLVERKARQDRLNKGGLLDFLPETKTIRDKEWTVGPIPKDLQDRRVEITGPTDRKMVINALNSGAKVFMADFEDSLSPTWENVIDGQINMRDAINRTIHLRTKEGKEYQLNQNPAVLIVRPRGWHLDEKHITVDGKLVPAGFVDFGLFFFHNCHSALKRGTGPYFYLPKTESYTEAALWNEIFVHAESLAQVPTGTIKATVLIETITAAFEMDEILHALKDYCVGLNCGRWDYIFSFIKKFHTRPDFVLPDRAQVTMTSHFLRSYSQLLIKTCHRRGAFAMGGMAAAIPVKNNSMANDRAFAAVKADKEREAGDGHDGTWVAHPALVPVAMERFNHYLGDKPNQLDKLRAEVDVKAKDLLAIPEGDITEKGLRSNINVAVQYLASWLGGNGCVPINNLMEDAATAEISRSQIWQWIRHPKGVLQDGRKVTKFLYGSLLREELDKIKRDVGNELFDNGHYMAAADMLTKLVEADEFIEFLTLPAYQKLA